jgi:hypothetical protein
MHRYSTEVAPAIFNPATQAFETSVTFHEGTDRIRIPCQLRLPIDTPANIVTSALVRQAKMKRFVKRVPLRSRLRDMISRPDPLSHAA